MSVATTTLYRPEAFEQLTERAWSERWIRDAIAGVVDDAVAAFHSDDLWPVADVYDVAGWTTSLPMTTLFGGAAGAIWGLDALRARGYADVALDLSAAAQRALALWRAAPDFAERSEPPVRTAASLFLGETGVLFVGWLLEPTPELADRLYVRVRQNVGNLTCDLVHGAPGTMLVARALHERTGEQRWGDAWRDSAEFLMEQRGDDGLWTFPPYGRGLGAKHGVAGTVHALLTGGELLDPGHCRQLERETTDVLARFAVRDGDQANWPMVAEEFPALDAFDGQIRVQWCHGAAGIAAAAGGYLDEELLAAGAQLVWSAGPARMEKGPGICHGTAGLGYAFLKIFARTNDELWLERARAYAVHALEQVDRWRERRRRGRYTLWTGDIGAALFAADCLEARTLMPILDHT